MSKKKKAMSVYFTHLLSAEAQDAMHDGRQGEVDTYISHKRRGDKKWKEGIVEEVP